MSADQDYAGRPGPFARLLALNPDMVKALPDAYARMLCNDVERLLVASQDLRVALREANAQRVQAEQELVNAKAKAAARGHKLWLLRTGA